MTTRETTMTRHDHFDSLTARVRSTTHLPRLQALLAGALTPLTVDFSAMAWPSDGDETWM
jgi:hypothetical protein